MKKNIVTLIIGLVLIGIGSVISLFEIMEYEYIDEAYYAADYVREGTKSISVNGASCVVLDIPTDEHISNYKIVYDDNIRNDIVIEYKYLEDVYDLVIDDYDNNYKGCKEIELEYESRGWSSNIRNFVTVIVDNLKDKKIYNYFKNVDFDMVIVVRPEYRDMIRIK